MNSQKHLILVDSCQALFVQRPANIQSLSEKDSSKLDLIGLEEMSALPSDLYSFIFLVSPRNRQFINHFRTQNAFLNQSTFQEYDSSKANTVANILQAYLGQNITLISHRLHKFATAITNVTDNQQLNRILFSGCGQDPSKRRKAEIASYEANLVDYHISSLVQVTSAIQFILRQSNRELPIERIYNIGYYFDQKKLHQTLSYGLLKANYPFKYTPIDFSLPHLSIPFDKQNPIEILIHKFQDFYKETSEGAVARVKIMENNILDFIDKHSGKVGIIDNIWKYNSITTRIATTQEIQRIISLPEVTSILSKFPSITVSTPKIIKYHSDENDLNQTIQAVKDSLAFPVLVKAIEASSTVSSHQMAIVHNIQSLSYFLEKSPLSKIGLIIQELINHSGIINKIYVAGEYSIIQARVSIPDLDPSQYADNHESIWHFNSQSPFRGQLPIEVPDKLDTPISKLNGVFMSEFSQEFRKNLGIHLFGYDIIQKTGTEEYYIVDINCFPGFKNIPSLVDIFQNLFVYSIPKSN